MVFKIVLSVNPGDPPFTAYWRPLTTQSELEMKFRAHLKILFCGEEHTTHRYVKECP